MRCVVFAAVSSRPQVERESIPTQVANAHELIQRRGWQEVHPPLLVNGQSRDIDFLHEAIDEISAIGELTTLAREHAIDLVIVRDYDRLARTRSLLTQISAYLNRCLVQIYALDKPIDPISPDDLARSGQAVLTTAMVEAFAGIQAQSEIDRLRQRARFGKDGMVKKGFWKNVAIPFGYTRIVVMDNGDMTYTDIPQILPEEAAIIQRIEHDYLDAGLGGRQIARRLNLENIPPQRGKVWHAVSVLAILRNPFYCGWLVWGLTRRKRVYDTATGRFISAPQYIPAYVTLMGLEKRHPNLGDLLAFQNELIADGAVVAKGLHTPLRTEELQHALDREIATRVVSGGRGAALGATIPRIFTGLLTCTRCGKSMSAKINAQNTVYYFCPQHPVGACKNDTYIREDQIYTEVTTVIRSFSDDASITAYLQAQNTDNATALRTRVASLVTARDGLATRRARWDTAYENDIIDLKTYSNKLTEIEAETARLTRDLAESQRLLTAMRDDEQRRKRILEYTILELTPANRPIIKQKMRALIARIVIDTSGVQSIEFR